MTTSKRINVRPVGLLAQIGDYMMYLAMVAIMYFNRTPGESPQLTHYWNNHKMSRAEAEALDIQRMVRVYGDSTARRMWLGFIPVFHLPGCGWQNYIVLQPKNWRGTWYVGWQSAKVIGFSRIPAKGRARALIGPEEAHFFALDCYGNQLPIEEIGRGRLGDNNAFKDLPLH